MMANPSIEPPSDEYSSVDEQGEIFSGAKDGVFFKSFKNIDDWDSIRDTIENYDQVRKLTTTKHRHKLATKLSSLYN